jgi:hypothetical protein
MSYSRIGDLEARIDEYEQAIATFARLHEELTDLRESVTMPEAAMRITSMMKLNAETLDAIKQSLTIALGTLRRTQRAMETSTANRQ